MLWKRRGQRIGRRQERPRDDTPAPSPVRFCTDEKKSCSAGDRPDVVSASRLSICWTWAWYASSPLLDGLGRAHLRVQEVVRITLDLGDLRARADEAVGAPHRRRRRLHHHLAAVARDVGVGDVVAGRGQARLGGVQTGLADAEEGHGGFLSAMSLTARSAKTLSCCPFGIHHASECLMMRDELVGVRRVGRVAGALQAVREALACASPPCASTFS